MPQISLASYSVRVREENARGTLDLSDPKAAGLFKLLSNYFTNLTKVATNNVAIKKVISAKTVTISSSGTEISGLITTGEYGYESDLLDIRGKKKPYRRSTEEAEMLPFYFLLYIPKTGTCGILILQRFSTHGIRSILQANLAPVFNAAYPDLTLNIFPQIPDGVLETILRKGGLKTIVLRKFNLPQDMADKFQVGSTPDAAKVDLVIRGKSGHRFQQTLKAIRDWALGDTTVPLKEIVGLDSFDFDKVLIQVEIGGKPKTVDLTSLNKLRAYIDITKKVKTGADGHPTFTSIDGEGRDLLKGLCKTLRI